MVDIEYRCADCETTSKANVGQAIINSQLKWYLSYVCEHCKSAIEMDDFGFPPDNIRRQIIDKEGEWKLIIDPAESKNKAKIIKILRRNLNLPIEEASKLLKTFPNIGYGTKLEMQWLEQLLSNENIKSSVEKILSS